MVRRVNAVVRIMYASELPTLDLPSNLRQETSRFPTPVGRAMRPMNASQITRAISEMRRGKAPVKDLIRSQALRASPNCWSCSTRLPQGDLIPEGEALHPVRRKIRVHRRDFCFSKMAGGCASVLPWRKSEPDASISPSCSFAGTQFAGNSRRSGPKLEQFLIQRTAGSKPKHRPELRREPGAATACRTQGQISVQERIRQRRQQRRATAIHDAYDHRWETYMDMGYLRFKPGPSRAAPDLLRVGDRPYAIFDGEAGIHI